MSSALLGAPGFSRSQLLSESREDGVCFNGRNPAAGEGLWSDQAQHYLSRSLPHHQELVVKEPSLGQCPDEVIRILGINGSESRPPACLGDGVGSGPRALMQLSLRATHALGSELRGQRTK